MVRRTLTFFTNIVTLFMLFILFCTPLLAQGQGDPCNPGCIWSTFNPDPNVWGEDGGLHCLKKNTAVPCDDDSAAPASVPDNSGLQPLAQPSDSSASSDGSGFSLPSMPSISLPKVSLPGLSGSFDFGNLGFSVSLRSFTILMGLLTIVTFVARSNTLATIFLAATVVGIVLQYLT